MAKTYFYIIVVILAASVIFLGFQIYQRQFQSAQQPLPNSSETPITASAKPEGSSTPYRSLQSPPPADSSEILDITSCTPIPRQMNLKAGQDFLVKNNDKVAHTIIIDATHKFTIPAEETTTLSSKFGTSGITGTIGYRCDNPSAEGFAGTFHISE